MNKQTPIQKAIEWIKAFPSENKSLQELSLLSAVELKLESLLLEEKQFAEDAYNEGCRVASPFGNQGLSKFEKQHWPEYYKQYEDGK